MFINMSIYQYVVEREIYQNVVAGGNVSIRRCRGKYLNTSLKGNISLRYEREMS